MVDWTGTEVSTTQGSDEFDLDSEMEKTYLEQRAS
jgi:hypothetical protein